MLLTQRPLSPPDAFPGPPSGVFPSVFLWLLNPSTPQQLSGDPSGGAHEIHDGIKWKVLSFLIYSRKLALEVVLPETVMHGPQSSSLGRASWASAYAPLTTSVPRPRQLHAPPPHSSAHTHLSGFVEDAGADLDHLQVLLLLVTCALDVGHPASVVLLAGVDEVAHRAVLVEHLRAGESGAR